MNAVMWIRGVACSAVLSLASCDRPNDAPPAPEAKASATVIPAPAPAPPRSATSAAATPSAAAKGEPKVYGPNDIKVMDCVIVEPAGLMTAKRCKAGFVLYGPYAPVPADAEVELSFEIEAQTTFNLYTEVVSAMGTKFYGALPDQTIEKGTTRKLGLRLQPHMAIEGLETRLVLGSPSPVDFKIRDFSLRIH